MRTLTVTRVKLNYYSGHNLLSFWQVICSESDKAGPHHISAPDNSEFSSFLSIPLQV